MRPRVVRQRSPPHHIADAKLQCRSVTRKISKGHCVPRLLDASTDREVHEAVRHLGSVQRSHDGLFEERRQRDLTIAAAAVEAGEFGVLPESAADLIDLLDLRLDDGHRCRKDAALVDHHCGDRPHGGEGVEAQHGCEGVEWQTGGGGGRGAGPGAWPGPRGTGAYVEPPGAAR